MTDFISCYDLFGWVGRFASLLPVFLVVVAVFLYCPAECTTFRDLDLISRSSRRPTFEREGSVSHSNSLGWHIAPASITAD